MTFSPPIFLSVGDEYDKRSTVTKKSNALPGFKVGGPKTGQEGLFQKQYLSMSSGDKFVEPVSYERRKYMHDMKTKFRPTDEPFKPTNPSHKGWSGDYFGTFNEKHPPRHEVEYKVGQPGENLEPPKPAPRNFIVSYPKKGGYGYANLTICNGSENKYISDPYDLMKKKNTILEGTDNNRMIGPPFKPACKRNGFFDETPHLGVSKVYGLDKPLPGSLKRRGENEIKSAAPIKPWVPGGRLLIDTGKYPYIADPYEAKEKMLREKKQSENQSQTPWKPVSNPKSLPTRVIKFIPGDDDC